jgi:CBS domain-containing protein
VTAAALPLTGASIGDLARPAPTVEPEAHLAAAAYLLHRSGYSALVVEPEPGGEPVALLTAEDVSRAVADGRDPERTRVADIATPHPGTVEADLPADVAARAMVEAGWQHLLVRGGQRSGVVDLADVAGKLLTAPTGDGWRGR